MQLHSFQSRWCVKGLTKWDSVFLLCKTSNTNVLKSEGKAFASNHLMDSPAAIQKENRQTAQWHGKTKMMAAKWGQHPIHILEVA